MILTLIGLNQDTSILFDTAGTIKEHGSFLMPFLIALMIPAWTISSFDATANISEEMHNATRNAPLGAMLANISAYILGIFIIAIPMLSITNYDETIKSELPLQFILESRMGHIATMVIVSIIIVGV